MIILKVVLTVLVIMHHAFITYGAPGGWYYSEKTTSLGAIIPMTMFVAVNQSFFMGFFFFLSALFTPASYNRKGPVKFLTDRLLRLGIPLLFYSFVLSPFLSFMVYYQAEGHHITYLQYLGGFDGWINFGVLWFVAALLLFTFIYVLYRVAGGKEPGAMHVPKTTIVLLFAAGVGLATYFVRIVFPVGWVLKPLGFQLGHFPQYIALFIAGLIAAKSKWLSGNESRSSKPFSIIALCLILTGFPALFMVRKLVGFPVSYYNIGGHWPSLLYAMWEQLTGFSMIVGLLYFGKKHWNKPSAFLTTLGRSTFAVYIFHPLVLIALSVALVQWHADPALKLLVVTPLATVLSFAIGMLIVKIPGVNKIV